MIIKCENKKCKNEFQNKTYGKGMRVHNYASGTGGHRCTVCSNLVSRRPLK